jgi:hypothetical protein
MAQYKHLPIYRITYELLQRIVDATTHFPRDFKFTLGQKMKDEAIELVVLIYRANSSKSKEIHINSMLERLQVIELLLRLSLDMRVLPAKNYAAIVEMIESLGKQASGWKKANSKGPRA